MLTRRRRKPRYQLDIPQPQPQPRSRALLPVRVAITPRRQRRRFRVGLAEESPRSAPPILPIQITIKRRSWKSGAPRTLAQSRQRRRLILIGAGALVLAVAVLSALLATIPSRLGAQPPRASVPNAISGADTYSAHARHLGATSPFANLRLYAAASASAPPTIQARAAFLFDPQRGVIFYQKAPDTPRPAASLTKIMTLLLATNAGALDREVTIGSDAAALVNGSNSYMGVSAGERLTLRQLLYGLMLAGGNDAALALADGISGGEPAFVAAMNTYAQQLGLKHTHFVSPDGVSDANLSSARDLAILTAIAIGRPGVAQITATRHLVIARTATNKVYSLWNTNDLLAGAAAAYPGVNGFKTGYTTGAGYCMAVTAEQGGHLLVGVILGDPSDAARVSDARALLDWGFAHEQTA